MRDCNGENSDMIQIYLLVAYAYQMTIYLSSRNNINIWNKSNDINSYKNEHIQNTPIWP